MPKLCPNITFPHQQDFFPIRSVTKSSTARFSHENLAVEDFVTLFMGKNLVGEEMFCLGMVSSNLYITCSSMRGRYKIRIVEGWKWQCTISHEWVRFARADKAVALQCHYQ